MRRNRRPGFTLIEMLVVIVVVSILMGFLLPVIQGARANARIKMARVQIGEIEKALHAFRDAFGVYPPHYVTVIPPNGTTISWDVIIEPRIGGNGTSDTAALPPGAPEDLQRVALNAAALPGQILIDVHENVNANNWTLESTATGDDVIESRNFFLDANGAPVDLNGIAFGNDDDNDDVALDAAECLYYFLCMRFMANPRADYTNANFIDTTNTYLEDPTTFEFRPGPYLPTVNAGPFYAVKPGEARDTDDDGYLELCDLFGNPFQYVLTTPQMITEPSGGNGIVNSLVLNDTDDRQMVAAAGSVQPGVIIIHPGEDWFLDTSPNCDATGTPAGGDDVPIRKNWSGGKAALLYSLGPNGLDNLGMSDGAGAGRNADDDGDGVVDDEDDVSNME